ncbi:C-C motif chemokine 20-like [Eucyclogobius newberryi]|uniref:C-C motif chemokine 20-like n=1 Tax=Eucyclogobius newberryi TaxID=166745 RepID=UPI003B5B148E
MALMGTITAATTLLCLVLVVSARGKASPQAQSCCTSYTRSPVPFHRITGIRTQTILKKCDLEAIIFYTVKNNQICANPGDPWVQRTLKKLSDRLKEMAKVHPVVDKNLQMNKSGNAAMTSTTQSSKNITKTFNTFSSQKV